MKRLKFVETMYDLPHWASDYTSKSKDGLEPIYIHDFII